MTDDVVRAHVIVSGRVQGVSYRAYAEQEALRLGVRGWVRNRPDRTVEAVFEGPRAAVDAMVAWCHEGSPAASVTGVRVTNGPPEGEPPFEVRR